MSASLMPIPVSWTVDPKLRGLLQRLGFNRDAALVREFNGVTDEINEDLFEFGFIGAERNGIGNLRRQRQLPFIGQTLRRRQDFIDDLLQVAGFKEQGHPAGGQLGEVEDIVDQLQKVLAVGFNALQALFLFGRNVSIRLVQHQGGIPDDGVHRRAQLMAHVGQKFRLHAVELLKMVDLGSQAPVLQRFVEDEAQLVQGIGFCDVIVSAQLHRLHRAFQSRETGHHDHFRLRLELFDFLEDLDAAYARHHDVGHDQIEVFMAGLFDPFFSAGRQNHPITPVRKTEGQHVPQTGLIVHH